MRLQPCRYLTRSRALRPEFTESTPNHLLQPGARRGLMYVVTTHKRAEDRSSKHLGNVLVVDDDRETREMLATVLSIEGFHAVGAEDGLEALHLLRAVRRRA